MPLPKSLRILSLAILWLFVACHSILAAPWTPADLGDRLWLDWWAEDLSDGAVSAWASRHGVLSANQGAAAQRPVKQGTEVLFSNNQRLVVSAQAQANLAHRAVVVLFRIDLTGSGSGSIFAINGVGGGISERQPYVGYNRNNNQVVVHWPTPNGQNALNFTVAENASQWHCLVSRRVGAVHYASIDGKQTDGVTPGESSIAMADWAVARTNQSLNGYLGDFRTTTPVLAIDSVFVLQDDLGLEEAQKIMGWAMWRRGIQAQLPSTHPYHSQVPLSTPPDYVFTESTAAQWDALNAFWVDLSKSKQFKGTPINLAGWNLVFEDEFNAHSVTNDVQGKGTWFSPTHPFIAGAATPVVPPLNASDPAIGTEGTPATYIQSGSTMTVRMQKVDTTWYSGGFCSVNSNGFGQAWMYPYFEIKMKIGASSTGNMIGMYPAVWLKSVNSFYNLCESYMEYDVYEGYSGDNDGFHNSYHNWPAPRKLTDRLQSHRWFSDYLGMTVPKWPQTINLFDGQYHTYGVMVTRDYVINTFDGLEMFRFPTPVEMKQPLWSLISLGPIQDKMAQMSGNYDLIIDYIRVYQNPAYQEGGIQARFTDGAGTASSDQYPGAAGDGWEIAWGENSATDITATVVSTTPLNSGGNYLSIVNGDATTGTGYDNVYRKYSSANGVVLTAPHTLQFDYRLDSAASQLTGSDQIMFFNSNTTGSVTGSANGFTIRAMTSNGSLQWRWHNGDKAGGGSMVDSGMPLVQGVVYHFTIDLDPAAKEYTVSIFNGTQTVSSGPRGYRTSAAAPASFSYLHFGSVDLTSGQTITQSLDNIAITP